MLPRPKEKHRPAIFIAQTPGPHSGRGVGAIEERRYEVLKKEKDDEKKTEGGAYWIRQSAPMEREMWTTPSRPTERLLRMPERRSKK